MPLILAIEPNARQATYLAAVLRQRRGTELVIAGSAKKALAGLNSRVPDVVLTSPLVSPQDETALANWMNELGPAASRVHSLTIPILAAVPEEPEKKGVLSALRRTKKQKPSSDGCEPAMFADQIASYVARSKAEQHQREADHEAVHTPVAPVAAVEVEATPAEAEAAAEPELIEFEPLGESYEIEEPQPVAEVVSTEAEVEAAQDVESPAAATVEATEESEDLQPVAALQPVAELPPVVEMHAADEFQAAVDLQPAIELQPVIGLHAPIELPTVAALHPIVELHPIVDLHSEMLDAEALASDVPQVAEPAVEPAVPRAVRRSSEIEPDWVLESALDAVTAPALEPSIAAEAEFAPSFALTADESLMALDDDPEATLSEAILSTVARSAEVDSGAPSSPMLEMLDQMSDEPIETEAKAMVALAPDSQPWLEVVFEDVVAQPDLVVFEEIPSHRAAGAASSAVLHHHTHKGGRPKGAKPAQDEWGLFDPSQCGFAALLNKLDEITAHEDADPGEEADRSDTRSRVIAY